MKNLWKKIFLGVLVLTLTRWVDTPLQSGPGRLAIASSIENLVPKKLAEKIATVEHQKMWGKGVCGRTIVCYDLDGSVIAYIVPYKIGADRFPSDDEIRQQILDARKLLERAKRELARIRERAVRNGSFEIEKSGENVFLKKSPEWEEAEKRLRELRNKCWGIGEYATIVISARKNLAPILQISNGLPAYYTWGIMAEEKAKESLKSSSVRLTKVFFGPPMDQMFEFEANGKKIWVRLFPLKVISPGGIRKIERPIVLKSESETAKQALEKEAVWVQEKWRKVLREVER